MNVKGCIKAALFVTQKNLPIILTVAGSIGSVTATVWACKQTMNVPDILEENDKELEEIEKADVDEKTRSKMKRKLCRKTTGRFIKNYWKPAVVEIVSIACNGKAIHIEHKRTVEATAVAASLAQFLNDYRGRVKDRYGEDIEKEIYYNMKKGEIEETITDEKGKEKTVKKKVNVADPDSGHKFRRYLTRHNQKIWCGGDNLYVSHMIDMINQDLTEKLQYDEFNSLVLNDMLEATGFDKCHDGMVYGLLYDYGNPNRKNKVEITCEECYIPGERGELEKAYILEFPIDGNIYEMTAGQENSK